MKRIPKYHRYRKRYKKQQGSLLSIFMLICILPFLFQDKIPAALRYTAIVLLSVLLLFAVFSYLPAWLTERKKRKKYLSSRICEIDIMTGIEFEELLKTYFQSQGYKVTLTPASHDYGADLILSRKGEKIAVQAKKYTGKVGIKAVQEISGAVPYYGADRAMVITNSYFTASAVQLAESNAVELWDRKQLINRFQIQG